MLDFIDSDKDAKRADLPDLIRCAIGSGLRVGELCAVRWLDLNLDGLPLVSETDMRLVREPRRHQDLHDRRQRMALSGAVRVHPTRQMFRRCRAHLNVPSVTVTPLIWSVCAGWH